MSKLDDIPDDVPRKLQAAMERGDEMSLEQLRQLIAIEAKAIGLTFEQAVEHGRRHALPNSVIGGDLTMLIEMLPES